MQRDEERCRFTKDNTMIATNAIARKIESLREKGAMKSIDIANVIGARPETVSRWNQGKAFPQPEAQKLLLELEFIVDQLSDFYEPQEARLWLFSRQRLLNGQTPADLIRNGQVDKIIAVVDQLRDSVYI